MTFTSITGIDLVSSANATGINGFGWADYDNDGDLDIFTSSGGGTSRENNFLWRNDGSNVFVKLMLFDDGESQGGSWGDYDNDGDLDLYITNYGTSETTQEENFLYRNDGSDTFKKMDPAQVGDIVDEPIISKGSAWGDIDNDGDLDMFVSTPGDIEDPNYDYANRLYINDGSGYFTRLTGSVIDGPGFCFGTAMADYNQDGFLDILVATSNANLIYKNNEPNNDNNNYWIQLKLVGTTSNKSGIGAKIRVNALINSKNVWQMREIAGITGFGQNSLIAHFGLGDASIVDEIRVEWPSGIIQTLNNVSANQILTITESANILTQTIPLLNGWNMFSLAVSPEGSHDMLDILNPIIRNLIKVIDENGNTVENVFGSWQNYIGDWYPAEGYYIKVDEDLVLEIEGTAVETPLEIPLMSGWNMIGYPCLTLEQNAMDVIQGLIDDEYLLKVIDELGNTVEKLFGNWQNYIGNMCAGEGYYVKVIEKCDLSIACEGGLIAKKQSQENNPQHYKDNDNSNPFNPMSIYVVDDGSLEVGDEVAVFYKDRCLCSKVWQKNQRPLLLAVGGDDTTNLACQEGELIDIRIWQKGFHKETKLEQTRLSLLDKDGNEIEGSLHYEILGTAVVKLELNGNVNKISLLNMLYQNYPNPFNSNTTIRFDLVNDANVRVVVYDINGKVVKTLVNSSQKTGKHHITWNGRNDTGTLVSNGIYFYKIITADFVQIKKMTLLK